MIKRWELQTGSAQVETQGSEGDRDLARPAGQSNQ